MRSAALCLLAIAAPGCNWVFGIEKTLQEDAAPPGEATLPTARLTWLVAVTDPQGGPAVAHEYPGISPTPSVKLGPIGMPLSDVGIDDTGEMRIPEALEAATWRLVFELADGIPRELHWTTVADKPPHAVMPLHGRLDRAPIPGPNTMLTMTPANNMPAMHTGPIVFTTGVWTQSLPTFGFPAGPTFSHNLNQSIQLSGDPGAPDPAKGDLVVLVDYVTAGNCRISGGSAAFKLALTDGPSTTLDAEPFFNSGPAIRVDAPAGDKVRVGLAAGQPSTGVTTVLQLGPTPSATMPAFTTWGPQRVPQLGLRGPVLLPLLDCTNPTFSAVTAQPTYDLPDALSVFPQMAHIQVTADRTVAGGPTLTHGLAAVTPIATTEDVSFDIDIAMPVPPFLLGSLDLSTADGAPLPAGSAPLVLTFGTEVGGITHYYEVVLHRITGTSTVVERIYTMTDTTDPMLTIDRSAFTAGAQYVFEIRAYNGAPDVQFADFTRYMPTQASAVVWTRTFVAQ